MKNPDVLERIHALVTERGNKWTEIASVLEQEGYRGKSGKHLTSNAIRKQYARWRSAGGEDRAVPEPPKTEPLPEKPVPPPPPQKVQQRDQTLSVEQMFDLLRGSMERRDNMLYAQITKEPAKEYDTYRLDQMEQRLTGNLEAKITGVVEVELNNVVEKLREEMQSLIASSVDAHVHTHLTALLEGIEVKERSAGPGRGHKGSHVSKFSATIPSDLYREMKSLGGIFSSHLAAACQLYLRARQKHPTDKE
ncbi:hypothetical protein ACFL2Q_03920 [Thermodesulfobacteriota bacterium]